MWNKPRAWVVAGVTVLGLVLLWQLWVWEVERVEVAPNKFLVVINRWGKQLPPDEIVAPDSSYKGIQRRVLPEGRHFLNPILYAYEVHDALIVPEKHCAVLIRKAGPEIDGERKKNGEFLARGEFDPDAQKEIGERGVVREVLMPGKYRINPYEYDYEVVKAAEIEPQQVGIKVLRWGKDLEPERAADVPGKPSPKPYIVPDGFRGVQRTIVPSGTHPVNPYVEDIVPVDVRAHTAMFTDIEFPSKDGFTIQPPVEVRYKVKPEKAAELFVMLCDDGVLYQKDETPEDQKKNPILQKFVLPLIRGYVRIEGSKHDAREYISKPKEEDKDVGRANPRERLQKELSDKVKKACEEVGVIIEYIAVGQPIMNKPLEELATQIREREQARITRKTNEQKVIQFKQEQELRSTEALAEQRKLVVDANTKLEQEKINAEKLKAVEKARLEAQVTAAQARLEGSKKRAEAIVTGGKADANVITADNEAEVAELRTAVEGFPSAEEFAHYHVLMKLAPALTEIFASDTSEFARVFSSYMAPGPRKVGAALPLPPAGRAAAARGN